MSKASSAYLLSRRASSIYLLAQGHISVDKGRSDFILLLSLSRIEVHKLSTHVCDTVVDRRVFYELSLKAY